MGYCGKRLCAVLCALALFLCFQPTARADEARIPLSAGALAIREFQVSSSVPCGTVFTLPGVQKIRPLLRGDLAEPTWTDLMHLLGTSRTAAGMMDKLDDEGLVRSAGMFLKEGEKAVFAPLSSDPFETGLECTAAGVVFRRNGNTDGWYVSSVSAAYKGGATRGIVARYLADIGMTLKCYSVFTLADKVMYVSHYPAQGGYWEAWAVDERGVCFKSIPSYSPYRWFCADRGDFVNNGLLLAPEALSPARLP